MVKILYIVIILLTTYITGTIIDKKHLKKIKKEEIDSIKYPIIDVSTKKLKTNKKIKKIKLVSGEAVISGDYFKNFIASLQNIFGGRLTPFESVMDRAKREAILRMKKKAKKANIIINVRMETMMLNNIFNINTTPRCAIIVYGTAITYEK